MSKHCPTNSGSFTKTCLTHVAEWIEFLYAHLPKEIYLQYADLQGFIRAHRSKVIDQDVVPYVSAGETYNGTPMVQVGLMPRDKLKQIDPNTFETYPDMQKAAKRVQQLLVEMVEKHKTGELWLLLFESESLSANPIDFYLRRKFRGGGARDWNGFISLWAPLLHSVIFSVS